MLSLQPTSPQPQGCTGCGAAPPRSPGLKVGGEMSPHRPSPVFVPLCIGLGQAEPLACAHKQWGWRRGGSRLDPWLQYEGAPLQPPQFLLPQYNTTGLESILRRWQARERAGWKICCAWQNSSVGTGRLRWTCRGCSTLGWEKACASGQLGLSNAQGWPEPPLSPKRSFCVSWDLWVISLRAAGWAGGGDFWQRGGGWPGCPAMLLFARERSAMWR